MRDLETLVRLRARHLMDQVPVDVDERGAVELLANEVRVPELFVEGEGHDELYDHLVSVALAQLVDELVRHDGFAALREGANAVVRRREGCPCPLRNNLARRLVFAARSLLRSLEDVLGDIECGSHHPMLMHHTCHVKARAWYPP